MKKRIFSTTMSRLVTHVVFSRVFRRYCYLNGYFSLYHLFHVTTTGLQNIAFLKRRRSWTTLFTPSTEGKTISNA